MFLFAYKRTDRESVRLTTAALDNASGQEAAPKLVKISVDATQALAPNAEELRAIVGQIALLTGKNGGEDTNAEADWRLWGRLDADRAECLNPAVETIAAYAVRSDAGATVCLFNRTTQKTPISLQIRLGSGVYKCERLIFTPPVPAVASSQADETPAAARLERLEGRVMAKPGALVKAGSLEPGQVCLLRFSDVARSARIALNETRTQLHELAASAPGPARKLRRILNEMSPHLGGLRMNGERQGTSSRLATVHRLLLLTAQAHSLHRNYQARGAVKAEPGAAVMGALEQLTDALSETSAVLLGLLPQVAVMVKNDVALTATRGTTLVADERQEKPDKGDTPSATVTISLANTGSQSVGLVKIGLDAGELPSGLTCEPSDPAIFGTLRPGQTVRATFHLRGSAMTSWAVNRCVGDVSYFAAGGSAHLRPRPW